MTGALALLSLAVLHGTALAALAWLLDRGLRGRISPALSCALWTVVLMKFFVPFGPADLLPQSALSAGAAVLAVPFAVSGGAGLQRGGASMVSWSMLAGVGYLLAVAVLLARRLVAARRLSRSVATLPEAPPSVLEAVRRAAVVLRLRNVPTVRLGGGPFVAGFFRPTLVVPFEHCDTAEARAMVLHELAHLRRGDQWVRALQGLAQLVFFFWPPVYWVSGQIEQHRELACDQVALEQGPLSSAAYARVLLAAQQGALFGPAQFSALEMSARSSKLERRIDMVLELGRRHQARWAVLAVACGAAMALSGSALAVGGRVEGGAPTPAVASGSPVETAEQGVDMEAVKRVLQEHDAEIRSCYDDASILIWPPSALTGKVVIHWSITKDGAVTEAGQTSIELKPEPLPGHELDLGRCISDKLMHWTFPKPKSGAPVEVSYPFALGC